MYHCCITVVVVRLTVIAPVGTLAEIRGVAITEKINLLHRDKLLKNNKDGSNGL